MDLPSLSVLPYREPANSFGVGQLIAELLNLLSRLNEKDLRTLSTDRNVPDVLRVTARKKLVIGKE